LPGESRRRLLRFVSLRSHLIPLLEPLSTVITGFFVACGGAMAAVWLSGFGEATALAPGFLRAVGNSELRALLVAISSGIDAAWVLLAAVHAYLALVRTEGLAAARRWSSLVLGAGIGLPAASAIFGHPLGPVFYPEHLGFKIGPVPFGVPLLWVVIVFGARESAWRFLPKAAHGMLACTTGVLATVTDANLEPLVWKYRAWWLWYPNSVVHSDHAPWSNYATWLIAGTALAWVMRPEDVVLRVRRRPIVPVAALVFLNALALVSRAVFWRA
jgi:uncharacterized membrane protein